MNGLVLIALLTGAFTLATVLERPFRQWTRRKNRSQSVVAAVMGDSRRLFANHFFIQSDVYLHRGYYPGIFDRQDDHPPGKGETQQDEKGSHPEEHNHLRGAPCEHDFLGKPRNWIDAFGRNFFPSQHAHLGEGKAAALDTREILPWIKLSAELDPQRVDTYTVGAFWLRQMNKQGEALRFLREGLRANPGNHEILFELGQCYDDLKDTVLARNVWELALKRWQEQGGARDQEQRLLGAEILTHLTRLEARQNRRDKALAYLEMLKQVSPSPHEVQKRIDELKAGLPFEAEKKP
jgi:tetratricopeptide (TPR) repeat protein